jgi:hypothetical protein
MGETQTDLDQTAHYRELAGSDDGYINGRRGYRTRLRLLPADSC